MGYDTRRAKKEVREYRKSQRAEKVLHFRKTKNFLFWLLGLFSSFILVFVITALAVFVIPTGTIISMTGQDPNTTVSERVSKASLFGVINKFADTENGFTVGDFPILEDTLKSLGIEEYVSIDMEALKDVKVADLSTNGFDIILENTKLSENVYNMLGEDFSNFGIFIDSEVPEDKRYPISALPEDFNPEIYYYLESGVHGEDSAVYKRAYNDDKTYVSGVNDSTQLYYGAIHNMSLIDLAENILSRINVVELISIVDIFSPVEEGGLIEKILGNVTIGELGSFQIDLENFKCIDILPYEDATELYDILVTAVDKDPQPTVEEMTFADLQYINPDLVKVSTIVEKDSSTETLYNILCAAVGVEASEYESIVMGDLYSLNFNNVKLVDVITYAGSEDLFNLLSEAMEKPYDEITLDDFNTFNVDDILLTSVVDQSSNALLYEILVDSTGKTIDKIKVSDLASLNFDTVKLNSLIPYGTDTVDVYNLLLSAVTSKTYETITLGDVKTININDCKIASIVTPTTENETMYAVLKDLSGKTDDEEITIADLSSFNTDNIHITTVLPNVSDNFKNIICDMTGVSDYTSIALKDLNKSTVGFNSVHLKHVVNPSENVKLYSVLYDATGKNSDEICLVHLSGSNLNLDNVKLSSVITSAQDNKVLAGLLADDSVTLGNIGQKIDELPLHTVFDVECFTKDSTKSVTGVVYEMVAEGEFVLASSGTPADGNAYYYISNESSIWLFMFYESAGVDYTVTGLATSYTEKTIVFKNMQSETISTIAAVMDGTVRQLVDSGIIENNYDSLFTHTIHEVLDIAKTVA